MSILRSMTGKSGGSVAKFARKSAILGVLAVLPGLSGCSGKGWMSDVSAPETASQKSQPAAGAVTDNRVWGVSNAKRLAGLVIADEPQAVVVGRDILASGGNAADAAIGVYFALAVTYPGAAGLGGGGACLYDGPDASGVEQIDFPTGVAKAGGAVGVPGTIRGFGWLHARHGRAPWDKLVGHAARLAGSGAVMSKATAAQLEANRNQSVATGRTYRQPHLAATLGTLQGTGAGGFYNGELGRIFVEDARRFNSTVTQTDLRSYRVSINRAVRTGISGLNVFTRSGTETENSVWKNTINGSKPLASDMNSLRSDGSGSTGFVVADDDGRSVTCVVSMNGAFGLGDVSRTTGIYFSSARDATSLSNMVMVRAPGRGMIYAGASGGGVSGLQKSAAVLSDVALTRTSTLAEALRHNQSAGPGPVNAFSCAGGLAKDAETCRFGTEPDSNGYGLMAE